MRILISNDDGIHAPGIKMLIKALETSPLVSDLHVIAPDRDRSAASKSLTLDMPLNIVTLEPKRACVNGTPTDCVHLALRGWLEHLPDMVVSGINAGGNMGDDVLYSGTVAAAMEGRFLGHPSIAVSLVGEEERALQHYETAAQVVLELLLKLSQHPLPSNVVLNVNVPDRPYKELKGMKVVRLGQRHPSETMYPTQDPRGRQLYWIGPAGPMQEHDEGTDFHAVKQGYVSLTPLLVDLTHTGQMDMIHAWWDNTQ